MDQKLPNGSSYFLCSIINHIGQTPKEGHYNMILYNQMKDSYVLLDDWNINLNYEIDDDMMKLQYLVTYIKVE